LHGDEAREEGLAEDQAGESDGLGDPCSASFQRLSVFRNVTSRDDTQLQLSWTSSGHESIRLGETRIGFGLALTR